MASDRKAVKNRPFRQITVRTRPGDRAKGLLQAGGRVFPCALGRGGVTAVKREGDGCTPLGAFPVVAALIRFDRIAMRASPLPYAPIRTADGWCDAPGDANYNRPVDLPYPESHEKMMRDDNLYDFVIVLDQNFSRRMRNCGSAIFFHLARPGFSPTEGCIAVERRVMSWLLPRMNRQTRMIVVS